MLKSSHPSCFMKKMSLKISQNSQKKTCVRVSFLMKLQTWDLRRLEVGKIIIWFSILYKKAFINPFHAANLFWYPLKISENQRFSDIFRGYQKRSVAWNELIKDTINAYFYNVICCCRLRLGVSCFIYFKCRRVSSIVYQSLHLSFN